MQAVYKALGRVAPQDVTVLILGESGTGKELVARAIYKYSRRAAGPFLAINCAAIPETLLESELFGHEKGAFTGADRRRIGKFEQCNGGTLFLDEVGDMTPLTQTKLLRVLQDQQFERVGGNETIRTDVRLIAATNHDLEKLVTVGRFRADLFYRLNVSTIRVPPLRERSDDLPLLVDHFLRQFRTELNKEVDGIAAQTLDLLRGYAWPGNVRELQSALKHAVLDATGPVLLPEFLPAPMRQDQPVRPAVSLPVDQALRALTPFVEERLRAGSHDLYAQWHALTDGHLFTEVLRHTGGNLSQAAKLLGIHRTTLRARIEELGIRLQLPDTPASGED
jgi:two-component system nitrogen regulation response regulator GlnG